MDTGASTSPATDADPASKPVPADYFVPGAAPGIELDDLAHFPSSDAPIIITCIDYCAAHHQTQTIKAEEIDAFLSAHRPETTAVRWINVDGLTNMHVISAMARKYGLHPLAIEDMLRANQRPKADAYLAEGDYPARLCVIMKMIELKGEDISIDQTTMFLGHNTVLTFQQTPGDAWDEVRQRIAKPGTRIRNGDASFLLYSLLDATVDHYFPLLEHFGEKLEELEEQIIDQPTRYALRRIHRIRRDLMRLRHTVWPMRELIRNLQHEEHECFSEMSRTYMRDVYDHVVQIIDVLEAHREAAMSLTETYMNVVSNRMNEIMKVLTLIGTIFLPLTFLAGVYGMNFKYMPEMDQKWAYPAFWVVCLVVVAAMVTWFRGRKWL